ncbi:hypothetical protein [Kitasatospora mediocidica]|uniref:hypothetical protein n=1 Tax=Kitasatospora mediocidica TaxID=58352 RepID=UPI00055BCC3E|nr:hypothetical protein [Kitasatospora mediocidica]
MSSPIPPAPAVTTDSERVSLSPGLLAMLVPADAPVPGSGEPGGPNDGSRQGSIFSDNADSTLFWYLPDFGPAPDPDLLFAFRAVQNGLDAFGHPSDSATLTFGLHTAEPADVTAARQANPAGRYEQLTPTGLAGTLHIPFKGSDGSDQQRSVPAQVTADDDGAYLVRVTGLVGSDVPLAYSELTGPGGCTLELTYSYSVVRHLVTRHLLQPDPTPADAGSQDELFPGEIPHRSTTGRPVTHPVHPPLLGPAVTVTVVCSDFGSAAVALGTRYAVSPYRPLYTLTAAGTTTAIIDSSAFEGFDTTRSEYTELTALGSVADRYPSFRSLYLGQVSGTVVAVPATYGIVRSPDGCAADCDALIDSTPTTSSGCRFHLAFGLAPAIDPADLAQLALDLAAEPTLRSLTLRVTLPSDLDPRTPSSLPTPFASSVAYGVGGRPHEFTLTVEVVDDTSPALVKGNLLLRELASDGLAPLQGRIAFRLDDAFADPVESQVILNLHTTSGRDDLAVALADPTAPTVTNLSPFPLELTGYALHASGGLTRKALTQQLPVQGSVTLAGTAGADQALVDAALALADPFPLGTLGTYVTMRTADVQRVQHLIAVDATGLDFTARAITQVQVAAVVEQAADLAVPLLTLSPSQPVARATLLVPVGFALTGLATTLTITATGGDPAKAPAPVTAHHDFLVDPVFHLTDALLTGGSPS